MSVITRMEIKIMMYNLLGRDKYMGLVKCYNRDNIWIGTLEGQFWSKSLHVRTKIIDTAKDICKTRGGSDEVSEDCTYSVKIYSSEVDMKSNHGISIQSHVGHQSIDSLSCSNPYLINMAFSGPSRPNKSGVWPRGLNTKRVEC